jgi:proline iminopeptidase
VVSGEHDFLFPPKWGKVTADAIAGARHVVLANSGHFAHVEEPVAFARAISTFVRSP